MSKCAQILEAWIGDWPYTAAMLEICGTEDMLGEGIELIAALLALAED